MSKIAARGATAAVIRTVVMHRIIFEALLAPLAIRTRPKAAHIALPTAPTTVKETS